MTASVVGKKVQCERMVASRPSGETQAWPPGVGSLGFTQERIHEQTIVKRRKAYSQKYTLPPLSVGHLGRREP